MQLCQVKAKLHEQMMGHVAGWKKQVPDTYYRTIATEDVAKVHKQLSPADKLWGGSGTEHQQRGRRTRGSLGGPTFCPCRAGRRPLPRYWICFQSCRRTQQ